MDYIGLFPIPQALLPARLKSMFEHIGLDPRELVEVSANYQNVGGDHDREHLYMFMAVVPEEKAEGIGVMYEGSHGVVAHSTPTTDGKGKWEDLARSSFAYDYVVASWGSGSFYSYYLAEKVWMTLGLTARCVGNNHQRVIFDDLALPEFGVAEGEISNEFFWTSKRDIRWTIKNSYLRKYLFLRGAAGVRSFYYQNVLPDSPELRSIMAGQKHIAFEPTGGWYIVDLREDGEQLLLQVWASVPAVYPELCEDMNPYEIVWPDQAKALDNKREVESIFQNSIVHLDDKFLRRYEQNDLYDTMPIKSGPHQWHCSPSYRGQWAFTDCMRIGRNMVRVPLRKLYEAKPGREVLYARQYALSASEVANFSPDEEHIVAKTDRFVTALLEFGDHLARFGAHFGIETDPEALPTFSRQEIEANSWLHYPVLCKLAQVAPLDMSQQEFLARCKTLNEIIQRIPTKFLKRLLSVAGCLKEEFKDLRTLKLMEAVLNLISGLNNRGDDLDGFRDCAKDINWKARNSDMAPLFVNNDLRIADAHETPGDCLKALESLGFDNSLTNDGYGRALDFAVDQVIVAFQKFNEAMTQLETSP